mmetsp:Transcript_14923/g.63967  ORF Transcript_14923/g.63967 Transcript_14923/m.63967 type:complete len:143 (-) Transcript_14923:50-478(-)
MAERVRRSEDGFFFFFEASEEASFLGDAGGRLDAPTDTARNFFAGKRARPDRRHRLTRKTRSSFNRPNSKNTQSEGGAFEAYAAAEEEDFDVGDVERDRFRYDHVPASMMLPKELMGDTPVEAVIEKPKRRTSARKKAGTKL